MIIQAEKIVRIFRSGGRENKVLQGISMHVKEGEFIAIKGRSGAGKSTLLYQLGLLDDPTSGQIHIDDLDTTNMTEKEKTKFRLEELGYVFQDYANLPELTALENVMLPLMMLGIDKTEAKQKAMDALEKVGLDHRPNNLPNQLSGGEQQRVSIARAIVNKPKILFADEPTANLDSVTAEKIMKVFDEIHAAGQTIIMITHDAFVHPGRTIYISDGEIIDKPKEKYSR